MSEKQKETISYGKSDETTTENKILEESTLKNAEEMTENDWTKIEISPVQEPQNVVDTDNPLEIIDPMEQEHEHEHDCAVEDLQCDSVKAELLDFDLTEHFTTDKVFESREELITWAARMGKQTGCIIVIQKSVHSASRIPRLILGCERGGKYRSHKRVIENQGEKKKRKRKYGTKKCDCPFVLRGIHLPGSCDKWKVNVDCGHHNHRLLSDLDGHTHAGRLTPEEQKVLLDMTMSGVKPKEVLTVIKERDPNNSSKLKHIYNARAKLRSVEKNGKSQMQQLIPLLDENDYVQWHRCDPESNSLTGLFWAHPESVQLAKCFPCVLIMESINKSNWQRWPVFEVVGVTSTMMSFSVCFAMFDKEREDNYLWALEWLHSLLDKDNLPLVIVTDGDIELFNSVEKIFPDAKKLLCRWHIEMNVLAKVTGLIDENECKRFSDKWNDVILSSTTDEYAIQLEALERDFSHLPSVIQFIKETWLPKKEFFISAWTDHYMHLGCITTSRIENAHARLKRQTGKRSMFDFVGLWKIMHSMINEQITEIRVSLERSLNSVKHEYRILILKELRGCVSREAMDLILAERQHVISTEVDAESCTCLLRSTHGLPCAHEVATYECDKHPIPLSSVHSFWKKLSGIPTLVGRSDLYSCPEFQMFLKHYEESDDVGKMNLREKLKGLADSVTPWMNEPQEEIELGDPPKGTKQKKLLQCDTSSNQEGSPL